MTFRFSALNSLFSLNEKLFSFQFFPKCISFSCFVLNAHGMGKSNLVKIYNPKHVFLFSLLCTMNFAYYCTLTFDCKLRFSIFCYDVLFQLTVRMCQTRCMYCLLSFSHSITQAKKNINKMNLFVKEARKLINLKEPITVVIGNESCDLDSAVCAVSLAYYYSKSSKTPEHTLANGKPNFLPVMNILRKNLPIKTEVTYFLQKNGIDVNDLVCWLVWLVWV